MTDYNKLFNEKMGELMQAVQFPIEAMPESFSEHVSVAIEHHTITSLECSIDEYERVYQSTLSDSGIWFMPQIFIALSALKATNAIQQQVYKDDWIKSQREYQSMSEKWDTMAAPYIEQAKKYVNEVSRRDKREAEAKGRIVTFNASGKA